MDFGLPAFWTQLQSGAAMEAPTLVEVDDLDASPAGSLETGSPSVYSDMGTSPSTTGSGSPVEAPDEKPVLLRASQEIPYVGGCCEAAAEAAGRRHQQRRRLPRRRPDARTRVGRLPAGRESRCLRQAPATGRAEGRALAQQNLHVSRTADADAVVRPAHGLFGDVERGGERRSSPTKEALRGLDDIPGAIKSVDTASSPAPWRSPGRP